MALKTFPERFQKQFGRLFTELRLLLETAFKRRSTPPDIAGSEALARFVRFSKEVHKADNRLKETYLTPKKPPFTISVYRTDRMKSAEIAITKARVMRNSGKASIHGTAFLTKSVIRQARLPGGETLDVWPEETEYNWHADIGGWPTGSDMMSKAKRTQLTQELLRNVSPASLESI